MRPTRQRPVGRIEGVGSGGLRGGNRRRREGAPRRGAPGGAEGTHRSIHSDCPCPRSPPDLARGCFPPSVFFTAAGGVCHSLVRRPWCRWFILNKLLSQKNKRLDQITWKTKCEDQITSTTILQEWTRLPGRTRLPGFAQKWTRSDQITWFCTKVGQITWSRPKVDPGPRPRPRL